MRPVPDPGLCAEQFKDVPKDHWAADYVQVVAADGVMKGYPDATFKGDKPVTRYELAVALERMIAFIEGSLKPEVERQGTGNREQGTEGKPPPQAAPSPQPSPPGEGVTAPSPQPPPPGEGAPDARSQIQNPKSQMPGGDPAQALKAGGFIAANSPLLTDQNKTVSPKELSQALSSVASRLIEKYVPPPAD